MPKLLLILTLATIPFSMVADPKPQTNDDGTVYATTDDGRPLIVLEGDPSFEFSDNRVSGSTVVEVKPDGSLKASNNHATSDPAK